MYTADYPVAISVAMERTYFTPTNPVEFPVVWAEYKSAWDTQTNQIKVPATQRYWISLSGGAQGSQPLNIGYSLPNARDQNLIKLVRKSTTHSGPDLVNRDTIATLNEGQRVGMLTVEGALYSDSEHQTALTMFNLADVTRESSVFMSVSRESSFSESGKVPFNKYYVNSEHFNSSSHSFKCPKTGTYFFSITTGLGSRETVTLELKHRLYTFGLTRSSTSHGNLDTVSRSMMFRCERDDEVFINLASGSLHGSNEIPISWNGFLYDPYHRNQVAWAAYRVSSWESNEVLNDPVAFDEILVNQGEDFKENKFRCRVSGYYYVYLGVGVKSELLINYNLLLNDKRIADIYRNTRYHNGNDIMGRSLILRLKTNDVLHVSADTGTAFYSTGYRQTCFMGMLLYTVS